MQFDKIESFVRNLFQSGAGYLSREEILNRSQQSDLGSDEKNMLNGLPNRSFSEGDLMDTLKDIMEKQGVSKISSRFRKAA